jgi:hypothetical protein
MGKPLMGATKPSVTPAKKQNNLYPVKFMAMKSEAHLTGALLSALCPLLFIVKNIREIREIRLPC